MNFAITLTADALTIAKLSEESESNESVFIRKFCTNILKQFAVETKEVCEEAKRINKENPYGFPDL